MAEKTRRPLKHHRGTQLVSRWEGGKKEKEEVQSEPLFPLEGGGGDEGGRGMNKHTPEDCLLSGRRVPRQALDERTRWSSAYPVRMSGWREV